MHAAPFEYRRAESVTEAIELLEASEDGRVLAGGQGLIPLLKKRKTDPGTVVDIGGIDELRGVERTTSPRAVRGGSRRRASAGRV